MLHLAQAGHRTLGLVTVDSASVGTFGQPRREGARETAAAIGLPLPQELTISSRAAVEFHQALLARLASDGPDHDRGPTNPRQAREATSEALDHAVVHRIAETLIAWRALPDPVTGICCFNDVFADLVIAAARSVGLQVPQDLSVIGIDDEPLGGLLRPLLTTIRYDFASTVSCAAARLDARLNGRAAPHPPGSSGIVELVERESVAPVPRTA